jgi:hypothetical protein
VTDLKRNYELVFNRFPELQARFPAAVAKIITTSGLAIETVVKVGMAQPKHGRVYKRHGKSHRASAPGESPAVDTGALVNSVGFELLEQGVGMVFTNQEYSPALEFGYARMAARPFFEPALNTERPNFIRRMTQLEGNL